MNDGEMVNHHARISAQILGIMFVCLWVSNTPADWVKLVSFILIESFLAVSK